MRQLLRLRRRLLPWLALLSLALISAAAEQRLEAARAVALADKADKAGKADKTDKTDKAVEKTPPPSARGEDVADTHQRLDRIYKKLSIKKGEPAERSGGCNGDGKADPKANKKKKRMRLRGCNAMPAGVAYIIVVVVVVVMLVLIGMALRSSFRDSGDRPVEPEPIGEGLTEAPPLEAWRVDLGECRRLAEAGDLPGAFAALHRCTLLSLEHERHLVLDQSTTNWAYVRQLVSKPELKRLLAAVTEAAERSVLGHAPPDLSHYERLEARVRQEMVR